MVKFINLETGYIFDGSKPYVFWFDNGLSTELFHTKSVGVISDQESLSISIEDSNVFYLLNPSILSNNEEVNGFKYHNINDLKCINYNSTGTPYEGNYIHVLYFLTSSNEIGEFISEFKIGDTSYNIGADFYNENESLYINLSNFGVEIPETIQKTIYESNVHEDKKDNILLNRKFKELLINYWDIIANRGSYKSLINSINWFEWGDIIKLREIWKKDGIKTIFDSRELSSMMQDKYLDTLSCYSKTTYYALYAPKEKVGEGYDIELNPNLINSCETWKWPIIDIMIKMSLLGHFYETFFMPIHLDLIHSTIEDIVFTNTLKVHKGTCISRRDNIYNFDSIISSVKDGDKFLISNVSCQVNSDTQMGTKWRDEDLYESIRILGVDEVVETIKDDNDLKTLYTQIYKGPGVLVPINLSFNLDSMDFIKSEEITMVHDDENDWNTFKQYRIYRALRDGRVHIDFKLLCKQARKYDLRLKFESANGRVFTKRILFDVIDEFNPTINIYKIKSIDNPQYELLFENNPLHSILMRQLEGIPEMPIYTQYIESGHNSIKFNHLIVATNDNSEQVKLYLDTNYYKLDLGKKIDQKDTTIYISKKYVGDEDLIEKTKKIGIKYIHNKYMFIPQFHEIEEFGGVNIEDYTIYDDTLCCIPNIRYSLDIDEWEWVFENCSTNEKFNIPSIQDPFITPQSTTLTKGFYNIIFKYKLSNNKLNEIKINSAFIKK